MTGVQTCALPIYGVKYHRVTKAELGGSEWVFDKPHFIVMNLAMGGNFAGMVGPSFKSAGSLVIDYVKVTKIGAFGEVTLGK